MITRRRNALNARRARFDETQAMYRDHLAGMTPKEISRKYYYHVTIIGKRFRHAGLATRKSGKVIES